MNCHNTNPMQEQEYMKDNYTDWETRKMTLFDEKLSVMRANIKSKYQQIYDNRPHTILIETKTLIQKDEMNQKQNIVVDKTKTLPILCTAITIKTNSPCGRKAKCGMFCGLHTKKLK